MSNDKPIKAPSQLPAVRKSAALAASKPAAKTSGSIHNTSRRSEIRAEPSKGSQKTNNTGPKTPNS